jgi:hypothetical protein
MGNVSDKTLAELEELEQAATPGPWDLIENQGIQFRYEIYVPSAGGILPHYVDLGIEANASFIAAARNALPDLLAEIKHLRALHQGDSDRLATIAELAMREDVDPKELLGRIYDIAVDVGEFTSTQRTVSPEEP